LTIGWTVVVLLVVSFQRQNVDRLGRIAVDNLFADPFEHPAIRGRRASRRNWS
jgi:hypothetical protein